MSEEDISKRKLIDRLAPGDQWGPMSGFLTTTFDLQPEFLETDYLPALFRLGAWDDRSWATRIGLERKLQELDAAVVVMEARRYNLRPRSLHLQLVTASSPHGTSLHAKVTLAVFEDAVLLLVGSANLTEPGYRKNREAVAVIAATGKGAAETAIVREAISGMELMLGDWLTPEARKIILKAIETIRRCDDDTPDFDSRFQWSGKTTTLWRQFLGAWPTPELVRKITIISPFWSEDAGITVRAFLTELKVRNLLDPRAEVLLLTENSIDSMNQRRPVLPTSYASLDWSSIGVKVSAQAVSGEVMQDEVGGMEGFTGTRPLHAKIVLMEGAKTGLAYLGSANFTAHGWGFLKRETSANIEAGLIFRRKVGHRMLVSLLPPVVGTPIVLGQAKKSELSQPETSPDDPPWPAFVTEVTLSAGKAGDALNLRIGVKPSSFRLRWSASLLGTETVPAISLVPESESVDPDKTIYLVQLPPDLLNRLLLDQEISISWCECPIGRQVPVNVDFNARASLPISPNGQRISEGSLLSYYQGQIAWEDLFPEPEPPTPPHASQPAPPKSGVDKSKIQSYQIRDFVEALAGLRDDLKAASRGEPAMRLALLGQVSPLSLAKTVVEAVDLGQRSATAAGFQLVEILASLNAALSFDVPPKLKEPWLAYVSQAQAQIASFLKTLEDRFPMELSSTGPFNRYRKTVLANRHKA